MGATARRPQGRRDRGFTAMKTAGQDAISPSDSSSVICRCTAAEKRRAANAGLIRTNPDFAGAETNHPFTMTTNPAVLSTKSFTPQVPLYH
jgi:hypothetical protein